MWKDGRDPLAGLAVLLEFEGALEDRSGFSGEAFGGIIGADFLPVEFCQFGFIVESVHGADTPVHEELDDAFYLGGMVKAPVEIWR